mmetsp:Transcript_22785/g.67140  ORF Transcript_22785/g.67140 Transcript_22785/m.67140 type:complete len:513 (-) Transcript_22785:289-1827(-)
MAQMTNRECKLVLKKTMGHPHSWPFKEPVDADALGIPDYYEKIKHPMDLGTVQQKLASQQYEHPDDFVADVRQVFINCRTYNNPESDVYKMAVEVEQAFDRSWADTRQKLEQKQREAELSAQAAAQAPPPQPTALAPFPTADADMGDEPEVIPQLTNRIMGQLLKSVKNTEEAMAVFNVPVDPEKHGVPDYHAVIIHPMDLGTIESRLDKGMYADTAEFVSDVRLVWSNAKTYNAPGTAVHNYALKLEDIFERELRKQCTGPLANKGAPALARQPTALPKLAALQTSLAQQAPQEPAETPEVVTKACKPIITSLRGHQHAKTFNSPVDPKKYPTYRDAIPRPMDLRTVLKKLERHEYHTIADCHADVDLIWNNACAFNGNDSWVARNAMSLKAIADHKFDDVRHKVATGNIQSPKPSVGGAKRKAPGQMVVSSNELCCVTPEMRNQLSVNATKLDERQRRALMALVQQCAPAAVRATSSESWEIDVDLLDIKSFLKLDTWVRRLLVQKLVTC